METSKFKTNIKCSGCVATVTPFLDEALGSGNWNADYNDPQKILTVTVHKDAIEVINALAKAGYKGERIDS
jgi:copper chaperone